jgi:hypothetical protein
MGRTACTEPQCLYKADQKWLSLPVRISVHTLTRTFDFSFKSVKKFYLNVTIKPNKTRDKTINTTPLSAQNHKKIKHSCIKFLIFLIWHDSPPWVMASSFTRFLDHTQRRTIFRRTPLDEWSARRRDFHLTTHNTHKRQTSMPSVGFDSTVSAGERPQTYALDRAAIKFLNRITKQ